MSLNKDIFPILFNAKMVEKSHLLFTICYTFDIQKFVSCLHVMSSLVTKIVMFLIYLLLDTFISIIKLIVDPLKLTMALLLQLLYNGKEIPVTLI